MYKEFYALKEEPFNVTADPSFFFSSSRHMEAFSHLIYGIKQRKGILVVTGEIGTGKTTLCRTLLHHMDAETKTALILNPNFSDVQLLQMIVHDLGIQTKLKNKFDLITALNNFLLEEANLGHNVVIIVDEAQNLKISQLEHIRLLSNMETEKEKLLQIILVGQPELMEKLRLPALRQLNQRISVRYHLQPLEKGEIKPYIEHRLKTAKDESPQNHEVHFTPEALEAIYNFTHGTPRMINIFCDRALLAGFVSETFNINEGIIEQVAQEVTQHEYH